MVRGWPVRVTDTDFLVIDAETTGLDVKTSRVVELGAAMWEGGKFVRRRALVNPGVPIPEGASKVHGILDEHVKDADAIDAVLRRMAPYFRPDRVVVGYNAYNYDSVLINNEAERVGSDFRIDRGRVIDVMTHVQWVFRHERGRGLSDVCARFGIRPQGGQAHSAAVDCQMTGELLLALIDKGVLPDDVDEILLSQRRAQPVIDDEFRRWSYWLYRDRESGDMRVGAGKYCGQPLESVPKGYWSSLPRLITDFPEPVKLMMAAMAQGKFDPHQEYMPISVEVSVTQEKNLGDVRR